MAEDVYCTLLLSDSYLPGAVTLAHSLRDAGTKKKLAALVTLDSVGGQSMETLGTVYDYVIPVDKVGNRAPANLYLMNRGELWSTFSKINLWRQTRFGKIVYLDADVVALRAPDELFDVEFDPKEGVAAVPDVGWPDCFNSGLVVLRPNLADYYSLLALAQRGISFDGADQGLLNTHFKRWHRISFTYNCTPSANYQYVPAYKHFQASISMLHFIGPEKPWLQGRDVSQSSPVYDELLGRWWAVYDRHYRYRQIPAIQQYVKGEEHSNRGGPVILDEPAVERHEAVSTMESHPGQIEPPTSKPFTAPSSEWDPTRSAPPRESRPEAAEFPHAVYNMSRDPHLFQAPAPPAPPEGMYFSVPSARKPEDHPSPIFPWEAAQPAPTRVFPEDRPQRDTKTGTIPTPLSTNKPSTSSGSSNDPSPATPTIRVTGADALGAAPPGLSSNAWDSMPEIERYIRRSLQKSGRRGQIQVLKHTEGATSSEEQDEEHGHMRLTDFPDALERPSLPVTPAPVRRSTFWGSSRDEDDDDEGGGDKSLPGAEGVPAPEEWDPHQRLDDLMRHHSDVLPKIQDAGDDPRQDIPQREMPSSAQPVERRASGDATSSGQETGQAQAERGEIGVTDS